MKAQRRISRSAFVLKGNGWYVTDYPSKERKAAMKGESGSGGTSGKSTEGSSKTQEPAKSTTD